MTANDTTHAIQDLLADYLNGHLPHADQVRVEIALAQRPELQEQLAFEQQLQVALRTEAEAVDAAAVANQSAAPRFAQIADRLNPQPAPTLIDQFTTALGQKLSAFWRAGGIPAAAFACLLVAIVMTQTLPSLMAPDNIQEFETATSSQETFNQPTLRIITTPGLSEAELSMLLQDNGLRLERRNPQGSTLDATLLNMSADIHTIASSLQNDPRVRIAKVMSQQ